MKAYEQLLLKQIDEIIIRNLDNPDFQLEDITENLKISRTKLYRSILKLTKSVPVDYIRKKRLKKAKEILEIGVYPTIKKTALAVGFRSPSYFSKQFYQEFKIMPSDLLKDK